MTLYEEMKRAAELFRSLTTDEAQAIPRIATALRQAADEALERAAQLFPWASPERVKIRALASPPVAPAPPFVSDLVLDALQRCERARSADTHPPMLCVACAAEAARAARFPAKAKEPPK